MTAKSGRKEVVRVAYEYKIVDLEENALCEAGLACWESVGIISANKVLMQRNTDVQMVQDGLSDPPPEMLMFRLVVEPIDIDLPDLTHAELLDSVGSLDGKPLHYRYIPGPGCMTSSYERDGTLIEEFEVRCTRRIVYTRQDVVQARIIPDSFWADKAMRQIETVHQLLKQWECQEKVRGIITIAGIAGYTLRTDRSFGDGHVVSRPFAQVSMESPVGLVSHDRCSEFLAGLFGSLYWDLGCSDNLTFNGAGALKK